jgi:2-phosphosulfolactate phosphatase
MKLTVYFTPLGVQPNAIAGRPVLVLDVLRTTTTMVAALDSGAKAIIPAASAEEALRVAANLERDAVLLAGEKGMHVIDGFALGNSPGEMTEDAVRNKTLVMATTNGTEAVVVADPGRPVLIGAITNFSAAVERAKAIYTDTEDFVILCSGRERAFALEDAYVAGRFAQALIPGRQRRSADLNDAALAALELVRRYGDKWKNAVSASTAAKQLRANGYRADVLAATEVDSHTAVPQYANRLVTLADGA